MMRVVALLVVLVVASSCREGSAVDDGGISPPPSTVSPTSTADAPPAPRVSGSQIDDMSIPRAAHSATMLADGRVLLVGGCAGPGCSDNERGATAEFFDPAVNGLLPGPALLEPRAGHTATLLVDGRVLVTGGFPGEGRSPSATAEVFVPGIDRFEDVAPMSTARGSHTASLLEDGRVLVVGGSGPDGDYLAGVELFDPARDAFSSAASLPIPLGAHGAAVLRDGSVLIAGGRTRDGAVTGRTYRFEPASDRWVELGALTTPRHKHALVTVPDGRVFAVGGATDDDWDGRLDSVEVWDPVTEQWSVHGMLDTGRFKIPFAVVVLRHGDLVVAGDAPQPVVYGIDTAAVTPIGPALRSGGLFSTATLLADGRVFIAGGYDENIEPLPNAYIYVP